MTTLVIAEHQKGLLKPATLHCISAAVQLGADVHVLVAGENTQTVAKTVAQVAGVNKVLCAQSPALANELAENMTAQILQLLADNASVYSHLLFAASPSGKNTAPRVAAKLDVAQISDVIKVVDANTFERPIYAGNIVATVQSTDAIKVLTVRSTAFDAAASTGDGTVPLEDVSTVADSGKSQFISSEIAKTDRPDLTSARVVVSGGRGLGSEDQFNAVLTPLAEKLGAAIGASRAAVDAGYASNDLQVGQTGKIVAPDVYFAIGISGAIQHLAGMKDSKVIVAINKDAEAPIFSVADYALEADLFSAIPELTNAL